MLNMAFRFKNLYYITHIENVDSILRNGILSHARVVKDGLKHERIYNAEIVGNRQHRLTPNRKSLWEFANLYFQPRNPMLYKVIYGTDGVTLDEVAIIGVKVTILDRDDIYFSAGNAASDKSLILEKQTGKVIMEDYKQYFAAQYWSEDFGTKRKIMAECLVPDHVAPSYIDCVYVANHKTAQTLKDKIKELPKQVDVIPEPEMFFQPANKKEITRTLSIVAGDMFFSRQQTLTISVNTVGVMGKGLASRAKYQFPDMYVVYQDLCKQKLLQLGKPYIYKRERSLDEELADDSDSFISPNLTTWLLLFPTKAHWKQNADIHGIEKGLQWVVDNYQKEGPIESLAMPALGCGLGQLSWRDVGPLMVKYMSELTIPVWIYLPTEERIAPEFTTRQFLLSTM